MAIEVTKMKYFQCRLMDVLDTQYWRHTIMHLDGEKPNKNLVVFELPPNTDAIAEIELFLQEKYG
jgi:hypothetical protein